MQGKGSEFEEKNISEWKETFRLDPILSKKNWIVVGCNKAKYLQRTSLKRREPCPSSEILRYYGAILHFFEINEWAEGVRAEDGRAHRLPGGRNKEAEVTPKQDEGGQLRGLWYDCLLVYKRLLSDNNNNNSFRYVLVQRHFQFTNFILRLLLRYLSNITSS